MRLKALDSSSHVNQLPISVIVSRVHPFSCLLACCNAERSVYTVDILFQNDLKSFPASAVLTGLGLLAH